MAERKRATKQRRRERKNVPQGHVHIQASFNNTIITITDPNGNVISWGSAGVAGFKGSRKSTPYAAALSADQAAKKAMEHGMRQVEVYVKGPGAGREQAIRSLQAAGLEVSAITDVTPVPHNGCRPPSGAGSRQDDRWPATPIQFAGSAAGKAPSSSSRGPAVIPRSARSSAVRHLPASMESAAARSANMACSCARSRKSGAFTAFLSASSRATSKWPALRPVSPARTSFESLSCAWTTSCTGWASRLRAPRRVRWWGMPTSP